MGLFGRRRRHDEDVDADYEAEYDEQDGDDDLEPEFEGDLFEYAGPHDEADAPDDGLTRLDLGSVRLPVPDGAQLQVEMDQNKAVRAVHVVTPFGQLTVNAYAAPRSGGLWREVCGELAEQLRGDGAKVRSSAGEWGQELVAALGEVSLRFIGVDGSRWMLRGVVAGPPDMAEQSTHALYDLVRGTVVVRGTQPMPVRTPLPIDLPPSIAQHIQAQQEG
ncbi:MAG: DUF3710 domain-containing protein [Actinophytocola sp.]|uniref:DUF3710 domain-containing protein n=1 Tax=Actinophytocola sp. TaxID=1872138 RepID=UPI003C74595A